MNDVEILCDVLEHMDKNTQVGLFLYEVTYKKNNDNYEIDKKVEISKNIAGCRPKLSLTKTNAFIDLVFDYENNFNSKSFMYMWNEWLDKCTSAITKMKATNYVLVLSIFNRVEGSTYMVESINPLFVWQEKEILHFVFDVNSITYGRDEIDYSNEDKELEAEENVYNAEADKDIEKLNVLVKDE